MWASNPQSRALCMLTYVFDDDVFEFPESFIGHPEVYGSKEAAAILGMKKKKKILHSIKRMLVISLPGDITLLKSVEKAVASVFCSTWEQRRQARAASGIEERRG